MISGFVWEGITPKEVQLLIDAYPNKNAFYLSELANKSNDLLNQIITEGSKKGSVFFSEIWKKSPYCDYSNQAEERLY